MRTFVRPVSLTTRLVALAALVLMLVSTQVAVKADNKHSEQIIFSGVGLFEPGSGELTGTPFGFWIWCQNGAPGGLYGADLACFGSMYVYALGLTKGVFGFADNGGVQELEEGIYQMDVHSADGLIRARLTNEEIQGHGPVNTVDVIFFAPGGGGSSTDAVVVVTGMED